MPEVLVLNRQRRHAVPLKRLRQFALELAGRAKDGRRRLQRCSDL